MPRNTHIATLERISDYLLRTEDATALGLLAKASNESAAKKNLELSKMKEQEQEWMEWRVTRYALRAAGAKGSDEGGGCSS
ncbi:MAG: hypothetical protein WBQ12_22315, partial [Candidatus Sulfotelmatobacter sp.]